jgi:hypothetical protein
MPRLDDLPPNRETEALMDALARMSTELGR